MHNEEKTIYEIVKRVKKLKLEKEIKIHGVFVNSTSRNRAEGEKLRETA